MSVMPSRTKFVDLFLDNQSLLKQKAAHHAVQFIESGTIIGIGSGSTARFAVERLGALLRGGKL
jgi:ribose 5-phosphate isomerase A